MNFTTRCFLVFLLCVIYHVNAKPAYAQRTGTLENELYKISVLRDGSFKLYIKGSSREHHFLPNFTLLYREDNPVLKGAYDRSIAFRIPAWKKPGKDETTTDFFDVAPSSSLLASRASLAEGKFTWSFPASKDYSFEAELVLPPGRQYPVIRYRLSAVKPGWYSVGYTGVPETAPGEVNELFQPLIWQERRFPYKSFLSLPFMCSLPVALVNGGGVTLGVMADPREIPFEFQGMENSRFGVLLRNKKGLAQPMLFAPVPGQSESRLEKGGTAEFSLRLFASESSVFEAYRDIAQNVFGFHDYRENATCSLNETLENMIDYAMNDFYSGWNAELKAPDYSTDVSGTVKLVSALHPLSLALITDDKQLYTRRALPMMEYLLSREKYLFSMDTSARHQSPSHYLKGPAAEVSELAALFDISQKRTAVLKHYVQDLYGKPRVLNLNMVSEGANWQSALAMYRMNGRQEYLDAAQNGADEYIAERINVLQTDFSDVHIEAGGQFWTDFAPKWIDLLELYEETKITRYLDAAARGAELFVEYIWMQPTPPDKNILINKGGKAGTYAHQNRNNPDVRPMDAPEQEIPAWRVSQTGLLSEASTTYTANRAVFLSHYAAYLLRLGYYTGETFFHDIARAAIVGRYANFPGYSIMGEYTTIYSRPDYPLKSLYEITYNNIYYNHIWPQIALLMDFLVSDAFVRSDGKIDFPHQYAQGYAYLQSKVYGDRPGRFYEDENVRLWMPGDLLSATNIQGNYLAGYGNGNLYLAVMNQSDEVQDITLKLNPDLVPFEKGKTYPLRVWDNNGTTVAGTMLNGTITLSIRAQGITALSIDGLSISTQFQEKVLDDAQPLSEKSYSIKDTPLGKVTGMIISMGGSLTNAYVWLQATEKELKQATLHYKHKGKWRKIEDKTYPYEFSIPAAYEEGSFEYRVEGTGLNGRQLQADSVKLEF